MKNFIFGFVVGLLLVVVVVFFGGLGDFSVGQTHCRVGSFDEIQNCSEDVDGLEASDLNTVVISVPDDLEKYRSEMTSYLEEGAENPIDTFEFLDIEVEFELSEYDLMRIAVSEVTTQEGLLGGGPTRGVVKYLDIFDGTAYVVLDLDEDSWSGSSISIGRVRPLIEKTLLRFEEVDEVIFGYSDWSKRSLSL